MGNGVTLDQDTVSAIDELVATGRYASREDVLRDAVRLVRQRQLERAELEALLQEGVDDIEAGRVHDAKDVLRELSGKFGEMARRRRA